MSLPRTKIVARAIPARHPRNLPQQANPESIGWHDHADRYQIGLFSLRLSCRGRFAGLRFPQGGNYHLAGPLQGVKTREGGNQDGYGFSGGTKSVRSC